MAARDHPGGDATSELREGLDVHPQETEHHVFVGLGERCQLREARVVDQHVGVQVALCKLLRDLARGAWAREVLRQHGHLDAVAGLRPLRELLHRRAAARNNDQIVTALCEKAGELIPQAT